MAHLVCENDGRRVLILSKDKAVHRNDGTECFDFRFKMRNKYYSKDFIAMHFNTAVTQKN